MIRHRQATQPARWSLIVLAIMLTLCLLLLIIVDYTRMMEDTVLTVIALVLLGFLILLSLRLFLQTRNLRTRSTPEVSSAPISRNSMIVVLSALTLMAAALRLYELGGESLWYDETWTVTWAAQPLPVVMQIINPLAYLIAHFTLLLDRSEFALRFAPALAGIALIPATYLLGRRLYGRAEGLIAAGFLGLSIYAIYHSQELRFYAWQMLFSTLTLYFLLLGLERGRWLDWAGFALTTILNLYSHPYAFFVLASEGVYTLTVLTSDLLLSRGAMDISWRDRFRTWWRRLLPPGIAAVVALAVFVPGWSLAFALYTPRWVINSEQITVEPSAPHSNPWFSSPIAVWMYGLPRNLLSIDNPLILFPIFALFVLGLLASGRRRLWLVLIWFLFPLPVLIFLRLVIYFRYLSYLLPVLVIVMAHGVRYLAATISAHPRKQMLTLGLLALLVTAPNLAGLPGYYAEPQKQQWRELIAFIEDNRQPGDLILVNSLHSPSLLPFDWYSTTPEDALPRKVFLEGLAVTDATQLGGLVSATQGYTRVWFVFCRTPQEGEVLITEAMHNAFEIVDQWEFVGLDLVLFAREV